MELVRRKAMESPKFTIDGEESLRTYLKEMCGVAIPDTQICTNHSTPWRAFCDSYFARHTVVIWKASRGFGGKSFMMALLGKTEAETIKADVNILGGSGEQSRRVLEHMRGFWDHPSAPRELLIGNVAREMRMTWGNKLMALMASQASVRGPHPQRLLVDEADEVKQEILDSSLGQTMSKPDIPAQTTISSTHQYADGTMTEVLRRAAKNGWPVHEWCWRETSEPHGWLPLDEIERKRSEVPESMWLTEYDLQEPSAGNRAILPSSVDAMFDRSLGEFEGNPNEYIEIEKPDPNGIYGTGADWARAQDWTIITTFRFDVNPARCVAWERTGRVEWPVMVAKFETRLKRYRGKSAHDATGIGDVIRGYLNNATTRDVVMVGRDRAELLTRYVSACEHNEIIYPFIRFAYSEHKYAGVEDVFGGGQNHHLPDSIAGGALCWSTHKAAGIKPQASARQPGQGMRL